MDLPEEIKLLIAKSVDNKSLTKCRQTCKAWLAALTPLCYKRLPILRTLIYYTDNHLLYLRNILQYVTDEPIFLSFSNGRFRGSMHLFQEIKNLQKLGLHDCNLPFEYLEELAPCTNLTSLSVTVGSKTGLANDIEHMGDLTKLQSLRHLELFGYYFNEENTPIYLQPLTKLPFLESIPTIPISNTEQMDIIYRSPLKLKLKAMYLEGGLVSHDMIRKVADMTNLTKLRITCADIDDATFSLLGSLCNLRQVCLEILDNVTDLGLRTAKKWTNLERCRFQLNNNYSFISDTYTIRDLQISECIIEGGFAALRKLTNLEKLQLGNIDGISANDFLDVPLQNLTKLSIGLRGIYSSDIEKLLDLTKAPPELAKNLHEPYKSNIMDMF